MLEDKHIVANTAGRDGETHNSSHVRGIAEPYTALT